MKKRFLTILTGLALVATGALMVPTPVYADPPGYDGPCVEEDALDGVTVVIDFQELDGNDGRDQDPIIRCSPNPNPGTDRTGLQALLDAGIDVTGTVQWGMGFICRLEGRPAHDEPLPYGSSGTHYEQCVVTPPAHAYWGYWHADGTGSTWTYSSYGAANRMVIPGGFEGWSFSLDKTAMTNPPPAEPPFNDQIDPDNPTVAVSIDDLDRTIELSESTSLTWSSTNATSITAYSVSPAVGGGSWSGALAVPGGTQSITPTAVGTYTYTIRADGPYGTRYSTAKLTVVP